MKWHTKLILVLCSFVCIYALFDWFVSVYHYEMNKQEGVAQIHLAWIVSSPVLSLYLIGYEAKKWYSKTLLCFFVILFCVSTCICVLTSLHWESDYRLQAIMGLALGVIICIKTLAK